ncbi:HDOD domain-containing protein [Halomonas denitrificans]|nr:HDOD domain-containing protein [Halomonas denitrificans]
MDIEQLFSSETRLLSLNRVVQQLLSEFACADPDLLRIARILSQDQALSAKVLRLANSAHFAGARQMDSVKDAAILLGLDTLKMLVICSAVQQRYSHVPHMDIPRFWRQNLSCAHMAEALARESRQDPARARIGGLLHSIGQLFIHQQLPKQAQQIVARTAQGQVRAQVERELLGFDYGEVGAELARRWQFPEELVILTQHHIRPLLAPAPYRGLAAVVGLARWRIDHDPQAPLLEWPNEELASLGLQPQHLQSLHTEPETA